MRNLLSRLRQNLDFRRVPPAAPVVLEQRPPTGSAAEALERELQEIAYALRRKDGRVVSRRVKRVAGGEVHPVRGIVAVVEDARRANASPEHAERIGLAVLTYVRRRFNLPLDEPVPR